MVRTSMLSLALVALVSTLAITAEEPKASDKEGFRVYSVTLRCQTRRLLATCATPAEAFKAAAEQRAKFGGLRLEVTTGSEGKEAPRGQPALYQVYTMACPKAGWERQEILVNAAKAQEAVKAHKTKGEQVEIIHDYAPKEVYHVYGTRCRGLMALQSTHMTLKEACGAAQVLRTKGNLQVQVTTGTKGQDALPRTNPEYKIYVFGCRSASWSLTETTSDAKKAQETFAARKKDGAQVEILHHYTSK
jgi:hypothetical protein